LEAFNLNNIELIKTQIPLEILTVVTGVSGSGKTTLIKEILHPLAVRIPNGEKSISNKNGKLEGDFKFITQVEMIDQNPIGKSTRSNPVTYLKIYDDIRNLLANQKLAKMNSLKPMHFSFNVAGGRCDECEGEGTVSIEMQFMPDIVIECETCHGKRFKEEILDVTFEGKNIHDILELTIDDAIHFFKSNEDKLSQKISEKLQPLQDVGLGYVKLGQSSSTLSGGEAQRIKLASFLAKSNTQEKILFIFDEPTTGLHFYDVQKLLDSLQALINQGHTVIVIEHNLDVIKCADWILDIGPDSGDKGGSIVFQGLPEDLVNVENSFTGKFLKDKI
jgi:excinuclease ABC subunit A